LEISQSNTIIFGTSGRFGLNDFLIQSISLILLCYRTSVPWRVYACVLHVLWTIIRMTGEYWRRLLYRDCSHIYNNWSVWNVRCDSVLKVKAKEV